MSRVNQRFYNHSIFGGDKQIFTKSTPRSPLTLTTGQEEIVCYHHNDLFEINSASPNWPPWFKKRHRRWAPTDLLDSFGKSIQPGLHAPPFTGPAPRIKAAPTRQNCPLPRTFLQFCLLCLIFAKPMGPGIWTISIGLSTVPYAALKFQPTRIWCCTFKQSMMIASWFASNMFCFG